MYHYKRNQPKFICNLYIIRRVATDAESPTVAGLWTWLVALALHSQQLLELERVAELAEFKWKSTINDKMQCVWFSRLRLQFTPLRLYVCVIIDALFIVIVNCFDFLRMNFRVL